jgi:protein TonB
VSAVGTPAATARVATSVEIVDLPPPEYPPRSRRLGEEGLVVLEVEVLPDGRAGKVRALHALDFPRLVEAAIEAAKNARFRPATRDGQPVCAIVEIAIRFRLN